MMSAEQYPGNVKILSTPSGYGVRRVILGFSLIGIIFLAVGLYSLLGINKLGELTTVIHQHPLEVSNAAFQANISLVKMDRFMKDIVSADEHLSLEAAVQHIDEEEKKAFQNLGIIQDKILGLEGQQLEKDTRELLVGWKLIRNEVISLVANNNYAKAVHLSLEENDRHVKLIEESMLKLATYARNKADGFKNRTIEVQRHVTASSVILVVAGLMISLLIGFFVSKSLKDVVATHKKYERALAVAVERFHSLVEQSITGIYVMQNGRFIYVNNCFCEIYGYSKEELLNSVKPHDLVIEEDWHFVQKKIQQRLTGEAKTAHYFVRGKRKDGSVIRLEVHGSSLEYDGEISITGMVLDVTERLLAEQRFHEQYDLSTELGRTAKIGVWEFDAVTLEETWTRETAEIYDLDPDVETNVEIGINQFQRESRRIIESAVKRAIEEGKSYDLELELTTVKGNKKWVRTIGKPIREGARVVRVRGTLQNITERIKAGEVLKRHKESLEALVDERTAELRKMINLMAGREIRMAELKDENKILKERLKKHHRTFPRPKIHA